MSVFSVVPFIYPLSSTHTNLTGFSLQVTASQKVIMPLCLRHPDSPAPRLLRVTKWYERQNLKGARNSLVIIYVTGSWYIFFYHGACNYEVFCLLGTHVGPPVLHPLCVLYKTVTSFVIFDIIYICEVSKLARGSKSWLASQKLFSVPEPSRCWCSDKLLLLALYGNLSFFRIAHGTLAAAQALWSSGSLPSSLPHFILRSLNLRTRLCSCRSCFISFIMISPSHPLPFFHDVWSWDED